ncbi:MAG: hypothetical protein HY401_06685 [Elusimicrobia bacterium]|nr:hypothetical protein [Elusimicrobiota bacterium]
MSLIGIGDVFSRGLSVLISRITPVAGVRLVVVLATLALSSWGLSGLMDNLRAVATEGAPVSPETLGDVLNTLPREQMVDVVLSLKFWLSVFLNLALFLWGQGAVYLALYPHPNNPSAGEPRALPAIALGAIGLILPLTLVNIFYGVLVLIGTVLLVIPGIWLAVKYSFAPLLLVTEDASAFSSFGRSSDLVKGCWWGVFIRLVLVGLATLIASVLVGLIPVIGRVIAGVLLAPFLNSCQLVILENLQEIKGKA